MNAIKRKKLGFQVLWAFLSISIFSFAERNSANEDAFGNKFKRFVNESLSYLKKRDLSMSDIPLDLFIVSIDKDFDMLPEVIFFAKLNILHPIDNIYICSRPSEKVLQICNNNGCIFIDENNFPFKKDKIDYFPLGVDRRGWLFQQLLKLNSNEVCDNENILILDSDTIFIRPIKFIENGKFVLSCSDEFHQPYREAFKKILGFIPKSEFSFVSHYMLFNKKKLQLLKQHIENKNNKVWFKAIIDSASTESTSGFSEYETYGNFIEEFFPEEMLKIYWFNKSFPRNNLKKFLLKNRETKQFIQSVSFHSYL